ncbi:DASS family transporter [Oleiphilus messinensis]|uniref:DASS family transporter n=1 Tax=Oleiphilus messinensis TaxID=141451 RepID=A0A1Y0I573_9GAMM|nr:DASS family sodium-coupled anion symporter [Oleiphilus messinensis]ARU55627.1 DASS family transporter [Oleiphilus messinensis]
MNSINTTAIRDKASKQRFWAFCIMILAGLIKITGALEATGLSDSQQITLLILIVAATLWVTEWVPLFIVSFLILLLELVWLTPALISEGKTAPAALFMAPFFSNIILLFMGGFVLSSLMRRYGLDTRFAYLILKRTGGKPETTLLGVILSCAFLSMWMSNTATTAMMLTMILPMVKRIPPTSPYTTALVLAIPFACNLGGIGTPIGTPPNAIALSYLSAINLGPTFIEWMLYTTPILFFFLIMLWRLLLWLYPPGDIRLALPETNHEPLQKNQWLTLLICLATVLGWLFGEMIGLKTGTVALFPIILAFWLGLLDHNDFRALPWDVLFMVAGGLALGGALTQSGLDQQIVALLPLDTDTQILFMLAIALTGILSTIMSNTATAGLIIPLLVSLALPAMDLQVLVLAIAVMCSMAMALPVSTPPNAIAFSSGALHTQDLSKAGGIISIAGWVVLITIAPVFWRMIL